MIRNETRISKGKCLHIDIVFISLVYQLSSNLVMISFERVIDQMYGLCDGHFRNDKLKQSSIALCTMSSRT